MPESRRDTGQRRPLPDISAMQDTGRSPLHLLLDDRASRDGACGSDRRRRSRDLARQPRTLRRQEDQGRPGKEGRHRVQEAHRQHHARTGHDERVHAQTIQTAWYSRAWFRLLVSNRSFSFWRMKKSCTGRGPCLSHQRRKPKARKNSDVIATAG